MLSASQCRSCRVDAVPLTGVRRPVASSSLHHQTSVPVVATPSNSAPLRGVGGMVAIAQERSTPAHLSVRNALSRLWSHFLVRRIAKALFTIFFVSSLIFFLVRLLPGSPVEV